MKARIAVLVSGGGTNLQALLDAQNSGILVSGEIALVASSRPDAYALTRAKNAGVEALTVVKSDGEVKRSGIVTGGVGDAQGVVDQLVPAFEELMPFCQGDKRGVGRFHCVERAVDRNKRFGLLACPL